MAGYIGHGSGLGGSPFGSMKWLAHGVSQCVLAELRGGDFKSGFVGAVVAGLAGRASEAVTAGMRGLSTGLVMARTAAAAVFGGLAAQATGGSFADGAVSAAFVYLFNELAQDEASIKKFGNLNASFGAAQRNTEAAVRMLLRVPTDKAAMARYEQYFGKYSDANYKTVLARMQAAAAVYRTHVNLVYDSVQMKNGANVSLAAQAMHERITFFPEAKGSDYARLIFHEVMHLGGVNLDTTYDFQEILIQARNYPSRAIQNAETYVAYRYGN